jgi:hypothetical protein
MKMRCYEFPRIAMRKTLNGGGKLFSGDRTSTSQA